MNRPVYVGTDCGATTCKIGGVWDDGTTVSTRLLQRPTNAGQGPETVVRNFVEAIVAFLEQHELKWDQVQGVGLAIPGPFQRYGVLDRSANLPHSFAGFDVHKAFSDALARQAGRAVPLTVGNDGDLGGVGEASRVRGHGNRHRAAACSGVRSRRRLHRPPRPASRRRHACRDGGRSHAGALHQLQVRPYPCGCGRTWGCIEAYTTISGLPYLLADKLAQHPGHDLAQSPLSLKERALTLRGLAQKGDRLALEIFDFQARAMGFHVANLAMALDPQFVVIGGGLMDLESTTPAFRERYLQIVRDTALPYLWPVQRTQMSIVAATLGDLSQAIGAALVALYRKSAIRSKAGAQG